MGFHGHTPWRVSLPQPALPLSRQHLRVLREPFLSQFAPFTVEMLQAIVRDVRKDDTLSNLRLAAVCLISFAGFLRFG